MKTKDAYNGSRRMGERFLRLWSELAQGVFPFIMEEVGELDYDHRLFVSKKIALHLLLGIIVIAVEQTIRMLC